MYDFIRRQRGWLLITVAVFFGGTGWALASIPGPDGTISACYARNGEVRIIDSTASCRARETAIRWNQQGIQGPAGRDGRDGAAGATGPVGPEGPAGAGMTVLEAAEPATISLPEDESLVDAEGPELTIDVPTGGALVQFMAKMDVSSAPSCRATATVREVPDDESQPSVVGVDGGSGNVEQFQSFYSTLEHGSTLGGEWVVRELTAGTHSFRMRYHAEDNEPSPCEVRVRNRHIYAVVLG